jgi:hypothetical protein
MCNGAVVRGVGRGTLVLGCGYFASADFFFILLNGLIHDRSMGLSLALPEGYIQN